MAKSATKPDARHGPLPALLVLLTLSTGLVDAATFLRLGHVFVANMTGNVVFLAFALGGATEFSVPVSLSALFLFLTGAVMGGRLHRRLGANRGRQLAVACAIKMVLVAVALALSMVAAWQGVDPRGTKLDYAIIALLAAAMGLQNATVRSIAVPGLTTTVLTMTLTGIAADSRFGAAAASPGLGPLGVAMLFVGAVSGAALVLNFGTSWALGLMLALVATTGTVVHRLSRGAPAWTAH